MPSLHLPAVHAPRDPNLFLLSMGAMVCFLIALATFLVSWFGGGDLYLEQIGGRTTLAVLIAGFVFFAVCTALTEPLD